MFDLTFIIRYETHTIARTIFKFLFDNHFDSIVILCLFIYVHFISDAEYESSFAVNDSIIGAFFYFKRKKKENRKE